MSGRISIEKIEADPEDGKDTPRGRLLNVLPHLAIAVEMARIETAGGTVGLGVIAKGADGSGRVSAQFEGEFISDLGRVLGVWDDLDIKNNE